MFGGFFQNPVDWLNRTVAEGLVNLLFSLPFWVLVLLAIVGAGVAWRKAGWPGVVAYFTLGGVLFGRHTAPKPDPHTEAKSGPGSAAPSKPKRPLLFPKWRGRLKRWRS